MEKTLFAFPTSVEDDGWKGMLLRDYFAAACAAGDWAPGEADAGFAPNVTDAQLLTRARLYYRMADAMVKASIE